MLDKASYKATEPELREALLDVQFDLLECRRFPVLILIAGADGAGKSEAIQKLYEWLDPRHLHTHAYGEPNDEERAPPRTWRYWRDLPPKGDIAVVFGSWYNDPVRAFVLGELDEVAFERELDRIRGNVAIFDRTWYGRVLVERVEGYCTEAEWLRAYGEINDFEAQLHDFGFVLVKFWLAISQDEQARRFEARRDVPYKRYKITDDDWRNREKWDQYVEAVGDMVDRTSTACAPWTLVEAQDKRYCRLKVLQTTCDPARGALT